MILNNQLQAKVGFVSYVSSEKIKSGIQNVLGQDSQRFMSSIITAVTNNPKLQECTNQSIVSGALLGESLKLSPSPQLGHFYLVPFNDNDNNCKVAQFQLGYKGYIQLAIRSGQYKDIDVIEIREGEYLGRDKSTGKHVFEFIENEDVRETKKIIGYMAYFEYLNGFYKNIYWSKTKMENHAKKYSKAYASDIKKKTSYSFWTTDFDGMAFKTVLRQLISKWGIMSIEIQRAFENDMATIEDDRPRYIDNEDVILPGTIENVVEKKEVKLSELTSNK